jgi:site-specific DNA recombinase
MAEVKGWPAPIMYEDAGISGTKPEEQRPALSRLMQDVRAGKITAIIILSLDRLARNVSINIHIAEELNKYGVDLVSCKEAIDTSTPHGNLYFTISSAFAQFERDLIAQRTKDALKERGKRDGEKGGRLPYGYIRSEQGILIDSDAAETVKRIFSLHRRGASLRKIAADISTDDRTWRHTSIAEIIKNKDIYRGMKRGESDIRWPTIITR